jgi:hypothetical protein
MIESGDANLPPIPPAQKKTNAWIITIVVIVLVCCCCFGVTGLIFGFWEPITQSIQSLGL